MSLDCTTDKYDELYARWLTRPAELLDFGKLRPNEHVLDLCGGSGIVSMAAIDRGAQATLLDLNPLRCPEHRVIRVKGDARDIRSVFGPHSFDLVVCRQAIGYIEPKDLPLLFEHIAETLKPGGRLVFNNFMAPRWFAKTYRLNGRRYFEAAGYLGDTVYHVQASPGIGIDVSFFYWHKHGDLLHMLEDHFIVRGEVNGRSARYRCVVKD